MYSMIYIENFFFFQAEDGIRDYKVTGVQTCALPIYDGTRCGKRRSQECPQALPGFAGKIGRASCRERGVDLGGRRIIKKKKNERSENYPRVKERLTKTE